VDIPTSKEHTMAETSTAPTFRRLPRDPGWVRYDRHQTADGPITETVHVTDGHDVSPTHSYSMTLGGYNANCGWCWLGYPHSEAAHLLAEPEPVTVKECGCSYTMTGVTRCSYHEAEDLTRAVANNR
jgi:hypothetical protein